jgi:hypothetical protein
MMVFGLFVCSFCCAVLSVIIWLFRIRTDHWLTYLMRLIISVSAVLASWFLTHWALSLLEAKC